MKFKASVEGGIGLIAGLYALLSPLWTNTDTAAMWSLIVLGALTALVSLASMVRRIDAEEMVQVVLGVLLFIAPWVLSYADLTGAAWTSWIVGAITVVVGLYALPMVRHIGHGRPAPQH